MMKATGTGYGIRIEHRREDGRIQVIEAHYDETETPRLHLIMDGKNVYLSEEESSYFLSWMATWYELGE